MKRRVLKKGTILERVYDYAPWWSIDMHVNVGDLFEYVGGDITINMKDTVVQVRPLDRDIAMRYWNLTMNHFIHPGGEIAVHEVCMWN